MVGALLDAEAEDSFINNLILSVRSLIPVEALVDEVEKRNKLKMLNPFLEQLVSEGSKVFARCGSAALRQCPLFKAAAPLSRRRGLHLSCRRTPRFTMLWARSSLTPTTTPSTSSPQTPTTTRWWAVPTNVACGPHLVGCVVLSSASLEASRCRRLWASLPRSVTPAWPAWPTSAGSVTRRWWSAPTRMPCSSYRWGGIAGVQGCGAGGNGFIIVTTGAVCSIHSPTSHVHTHVCSLTLPTRCCIAGAVHCRA